MNNPLLSTLFLRMMDKIRQNKPGLVHEISNLFDMDEVSVYRRLRGDVRFSADEMGILAHKYAISLDKLLSEQPEGDYPSWKMDLPLTVTEQGFDMETMEQSIPLLRQLLEEPLTEAGGAIGFLTRHFFMQYKELSRFMLFKWGRYYSDIESFKRFDTVEMPDRLSNLFVNHVKEYSRVKYTFYIWDSKIIAKLIEDMQYFKSISLLSEEEIAGLKKELFALLDECETRAAEGRFKETGNPFDLYISPMNIDTSQVYMRFGDYWFYSVEAYGIRSFLTFKPHVCKEMCHRINNLKLTSVLISNSAEKERILFFKKQREMVDKL